MLHAEVLREAANLNFGRPAELRDRIARLEGQRVATPQPEGKGRGRRPQRP